MKLHRLAVALSAISLAILTAGCSSTEDKPKEATSTSTAQPQKEPVLYTGREAFNRMMGLALKWSPDAQPARLESVLTAETNGQDGKATLWRGFFASPSRRSVTREHGGEAILKKNAQQPITYVLLKDRKQNVPVWYVIYGTSEKDRKGICVINATTGAFVSAGK